MFATIKRKMAEMATKLQEIYDPNYIVLFEALHNNDWEKIKRLNLVKNPYVNKYAHANDNILIIEAIEAKEFRLVRELLELENVQATLSIDQRESILSQLPFAELVYLGPVAPANNNKRRAEGELVVEAKRAKGDQERAVERMDLAPAAEERPIFFKAKRRANVEQAQKAVKAAFASAFGDAPAAHFAENAAALAVFANNRRRDEQLDQTVECTAVNPVSEYEAFLSRIKKSKGMDIHPKLDRLITPEHLGEIYDYFLVHRPEIAAMNPGSSLRFAKEETGLPRTVNIVRSKNGEFKLIVDTKSKLRDGTKQKLPKVAGGYKSGKSAWRVDGEQVEYFNLRAFIKSDRDLNGIQKEVKISQDFASEWTTVNELGVLHKKKGRHKINLYSIKAEGDLNYFLYKKRVLLSEQQKNRFITDLLNGVKLFHDKNKAYQDLKPYNILVYALPEEGYKLKLTDYGMVVNHDVKSEKLGFTFTYRSPEIEHACSTPDSLFYKYVSLPDPNGEASFLKSMYEQNKHRYSEEDRDRFDAPHMANDMWAVGIIIFEIKYGKRLKDTDLELVQSDPLLSALLTPDRSSRFNIDEAIQAHMHQCEQVQVKKRIKI